MLNLMSQGEEIPAAKHRRGRHVRPVSSSDAERQGGLYCARAAGVRKAELARRMGIPRPTSTACSISITPRGSPSWRRSAPGTSGWCSVEDAA